MSARWQSEEDARAEIKALVSEYYKEFKKENTSFSGKFFQNII